MTTVRRKLLFTGPALHDAARQRLTDAGFDIQCDDSLSQTDLHRALTKGAEVYMYGGHGDANAAALQAGRLLRHVAFLGTDAARLVDIAVATQLGIAVTNAPGANANAVAEGTCALLLALLRQIPFVVNEVHSGRTNSVVTRELRGTQVGIIGMGRIGSQVARILHHGFGANIVYFSRESKADVDAELDAECLPLLEVLKRASVVCVHVQASATPRLLDRDELMAMPEGAILVNTAAPEVVDGSALAEVLEAGRLYAAQDGRYRDTTVQRRLDRLPINRYIDTPPIAYMTREASVRAVDMCVDSTLALLRGETPPHLLNPDFAARRRKIPD